VVIINISQILTVPLDKKKSGAKLKKAMSSRHCSIKYLSLYLGVSEKTVKKWLTGVSFPSVSNTVRIRQVLGVTMDDILVEKN